jgi:hypothetical protein
MKGLTPSGMISSFDQQLKRIRKRLEPTRSHPVLQERQHFMVGPFVQQTADDQEQATGKDQQGTDPEKNIHLALLR